MKCVNMRLIIGTLIAALPLSAGLIPVVEPDRLETGLFVSRKYTLSTNGGGQIPEGHVGFVPPNGPLVTPDGLKYSKYLSALPAGTVLTGATVDLSGAFSTKSIVGSPRSKPFYTPAAFNAEIGLYTVQISSKHATVQLAGADHKGYDLWNDFKLDLLAGNPIEVTWSAALTLSANNDTYVKKSCKGCTAEFDVTASSEFSAFSAANSLNLLFSNADALVHAAEPGSMSLTGAGLILSAVVTKRFRRRKQ